MKHIKRLVIFIMIAAIASLYFLLGNHDVSDIKVIDKIAYSSDGFVDASTLSNTNKLVASNQNFDLYIDETTSYFKVYDKVNQVTYQSNPTQDDPWVDDANHLITNTAIEKQKSTLEIQYVNEKGSLTTINNYTYSIYHPKTILDDEGLRTFGIKYIDNGVQIKYEIEDLEIDYLYFPKYIPIETFEALEDFNLLKSLAYKGIDEELGVYKINDEEYESMSELVRKNLYRIFYEKLGYTREQAIAENESYGYFESFEKIRFEIAIELSLTDEGLKTTIIKDSIEESKSERIAKITLYPLFGTAISIDEFDQPTEGYLVIPDGSGAIIEFNNGKYFQNAYNKRLYGQDLSLMPNDMAEQQEKIAIPVYGMVKDDHGFAAIITKGDAMASIQADVSGRIDSYNKIYTSFTLREVESVVIGSGFNQYGVDLYTDDIVDTDFEVTYKFLGASDANYAGIASVYRDHLINTYGLTQSDDTNQTVLTAEFIGAYDKESFFLGVPYDSMQSMTTYEEALDIINELQDLGIQEMNVLYQGTYNGGLKQSLSDEVDFEKVLGGEKGYLSLYNYLLDEGIELYQGTSLMQTNSYHKIFDKFRYTAQRIDGSHAIDYAYHYPSGLPYSETDFDHSVGDYVINPLYYQSIYEDFNKDYDYSYVALHGIGSMLAGNYNEKELVYVQDAINLQLELLGSIEQSLMLNNPLGYAISYANYISDLPTETTLYSIIDYQIPLLQLVLSGFVDYSGQSMNLASDRSINYQFLKAIETGSNLKYTLTYDDSIELLSTEYNYYMATKYYFWLDTIASQVQELDGIGLHEGHLIGHEQLANNVYKVTYSHGLVIYINYNLSDVLVNGVNVGSMNYTVVEVAQP